MREITLSKGLIALIDDEDWELVSQYKWFAVKKARSFYATTKIKRGGKHKNISMHRLIMDAKPGQTVDHIDGNSQDNQKKNLRFCTNSQNHMNRHYTYGSSKYKGVSWDKYNKKWCSSICYSKKHIALGRYPIEEDAARAYDDAAKKYFGEFACLNFPQKEK
jgi:hypothetical protein